MSTQPSLGLRISRWLVDNPAGGGLRNILAAMPAGTKRPVVASALATLVRTSKALSHKRPGERYQHYSAGPYALIDRRLKANQPLPAPPPAPPKQPREPKAKRERAPARPRGLSTVTTPTAIKLPARTVHADDVSADVAAFLKAGGRIQRLPIGASANPLTHCGHRAVNEATWRERDALVAKPKPKPEPPVNDQPEPLSGPDFLDACADANASSGLDVNAAEFRRRAQQWRAEQKRLADLEQTATAGQATLDDLRHRINQVVAPTQRMTG